MFSLEKIPCLKIKSERKNQLFKGDLFHGFPFFAFSFLAFPQGNIGKEMESEV